MDQPYLFWADWLSKFQTSSPFIQALWLTMPLLTVLALIALAWLVLHAPRRSWRGILIYGVYQDAQGRWMMYWHGRKAQEIDWTNPPPELIGRGTVIQRVFRKPEV